MKRPRYFVRVNGLAASADMHHDRALAAADRAITARPDAVISLAQVDPATDRVMGEFILHRPA
jgi:hypothetical protein